MGLAAPPGARFGRWRRVSISRLLRPRDEVFAAHASTALFLVGGFLLICYDVVEPVPAAAWALPLSLCVLAGLLGLAALPHLLGPAGFARAGVWPLLPRGGVTAFGGLAFLFPNELSVAHPLLALPVLFAASQLRPAIAVVVTGLAVAFDAAADAVILPAEQA